MDKGESSGGLPLRRVRLRNGLRVLPHPRGGNCRGRDREGATATVITEREGILKIMGTCLPNGLSIFIIYLSIYLSIHLSLSLYLMVYLSIIYQYLPICLSIIYLYRSLSPSHLSISRYIYLCIYLYLSVIYHLSLYIYVSF